MTLKSDAKFKEKLTLGSKNDVRNLENFNTSSSKSENLHFDMLLGRKYIMFEPKSTGESCVITLMNDPNFEEKLTFF